MEFNKVIENEISDRDQKWYELTEEWYQSGLSMAEWCRRRGDISYDSFRLNKKRLFPDEVEPATWSTISMEMPSSTFDVFINGCRVVVSSGFDQELLHELVEVLKK